MSRPRKAPGGLPRTLAFRVTAETGASFDAKVKAAGISPSEFFRQAVVENRTKVIERPRPNADFRRLVFLFSKTANNVNQLAHRANSAHLAGSLDHRTFDSICYELESIRRFLKQAIPPC